MTSFIIGSDGINVQRLKGDNRIPGAAAAISPVAASRAIHKTTDSAKTSQTKRVKQRIEKRRFTKRRRRLDRRIRNRRIRTIHVLLDTRSHHERRTFVQRADNRKGRYRIRQSGINITV